MPRKLVLRPEASADAVFAAEWYERRLGELGKRFSDELDKAISAIVANPSRFPIFTVATRRARLRSFPYGVFYVASRSSIIVLAVFHLKRNPRELRKALRHR